MNTEHRNRERERINRIFDVLMVSISPRSSFRRFVVDVKRQWDEEAWLSRKQKDALEKAYEMEAN